MQFIAKYDTRKLLEQIKEFNKGIVMLFESSRGFSMSERKVGEIAIRMYQPSFGHLVDETRSKGGEVVEPACADYWYGLALAYAFVGRKEEGQGFLEKARKIRIGSGSVLFEQCQRFYKNN